MRQVCSFAAWKGKGRQVALTFPTKHQQKCLVPHFTHGISCNCHVPRCLVTCVGVWAFLCFVKLSQLDCAIHNCSTHYFQFLQELAGFA